MAAQLHSDDWIAFWKARDDLGSSDNAARAFAKRHGITIYRVGGGEIVRRSEWLAAVSRDLSTALSPDACQ